MRQWGGIERNAALAFLGEMESFVIQALQGKGNRPRTLRYLNNIYRPFSSNHSLIDHITTHLPRYTIFAQPPSFKFLRSLDVMLDCGGTDISG